MEHLGMELERLGAARHVHPLQYGIIGNALLQVDFVLFASVVAIVNRSMPRI